MSHSIENRYLGELRTHSTHLKSLDTIITDAPVDNNNLSDQQTEKLVAVAKGCPVAQSLSSDLIQEVKFNF